MSDFPGTGGLPGVVTRDRLLAVVDERANRPPNAAFTISPRQPRAGEQVFFDARASSDPDFYDNPPFNSLRFRWEFGDGRSSFGDDSPEHADEVHRYSQPGTYRLLMLVIDSFGKFVLARPTLTVLEAGTRTRPRQRGSR